MKYKLYLDEENYLTGFAHTETSEDKYELNPSEMNLAYINCYKVKSDNLTWDEVKYEEVKAKEEEEAKKPTTEEKLEAQVLYTALMTDTMLEEE